MQDIEQRDQIPNSNGTRARSDRHIGPVDVAVVGAGITGLSVAWHLRRAGAARVAVLERAGVGAEASGVQPGGVRQQWGTRVNCEMARESLLFYRSLADRLGAPLDVRFDACGYLFVAHSQPALAALAEANALQRSLGIPSALLTPAEVAAVIEGLDPDAVAGAAFCAEDGYFDRPQSVVEAFAAAARGAGVRVEHADVISLAPAGDGWEVSLADGRAVAAEHVVVAAGYGTPPLLAGVGFAVPIRKEPKYLFLSEPIGERLLEPLVVSGERRFAAKQLANGRVLASDVGAAGDPEHEEAGWRRHVRACIGELTPRLEYVSFPTLVVGYYDVTPDHQAIVGPAPGLPGLWLAAGFSGHGFMMAPAVGRALAAAIVDGERDGWLDDLSGERFASGRLVVEQQVV